MDEIHRTTGLQDKRRRRKCSKRTCGVCGHEFYAINEITGKHGGKNIHQSKYCSKACWSIRSTVFVNCGNCGKEVKTTKSEHKQFCNMECRNAGYRYKLGNESNAWKGENASYSAIHKWVYDKYGTPDTCEKCGNKGKGKYMNWANVSGKYKRERDDWMRLCPTCHRLYDNIKKRK